MKNLILSAFILLNSCSILKKTINNDIEELGYYDKFYTNIPMSTGSLTSQKKNLGNEEIKFEDSEKIIELQYIINNSRVVNVLPSKIGMKTLFALITLKNRSKILIAVFENRIIDVNNNLSYEIKIKSDIEKMRLIIKRIRNL